MPGMQKIEESKNCSEIFYKWICCKNQEGEEIADFPPKAIGSLKSSYDRPVKLKSSIRFLTFSDKNPEIVELQVCIY